MGRLMRGRATWRLRVAGVIEEQRIYSKEGAQENESRGNKTRGGQLSLSIEKRRQKREASRPKDEEFDERDRRTTAGSSQQV